MTKLSNFLRNSFSQLNWRTVNTCLNNNLARSAALMPIIGYAIIMNDYFSQHFVFNNLTGGSEQLISTGLKLRFLYIGLFFLGISYVFYTIFRPKAFDISTNLDDYSKKYLESITAHEIKFIIEYLENYYKRDQILPFAIQEIEQLKRTGSNFLNWREKPQYRDLFILIIKMDFERQINKHKFFIHFCMITLLIGYSFIVVSSFDVLYRVTRSSLLGQ